MKKAFAWLDGHAVAYTFHDYRAQGVSRADLERWCAAAGWEKVINRAGTTFRQLPEEAKSGLDETKAIALMLEKPAMIKRPVLEIGDAIEIGFKPERYDALLAR